MNKELVSVIIPSYGRPDYLADSIQSILQQDYAAIELIVVDDNGRGSASQLATEELIHSLQVNYAIRYIVHEENRGGAAARNTGVEAASGELIALLDNDDSALPQRISRQVAALKDANSMDHSIQACLCLAIRKKYGAEIDRGVPKYKNNYLFELLAIHENLNIGSTILLYKETYNQLQGFDSRFRRNQDVEFMIRFYENYDATILNEHLTIINIDDRSNIPTYTKIAETKALLLKKYKTLIERFPERQQREIYKNHSLEIAKVALWNKNIGGFLKAYKNARLTLKESLAFIYDVCKKTIMHLK